MRQAYWKPQHEVFVRCMQKHEDPTKAYRTAYPKASTASARVGGHRLYSYPHIRQRIEPMIKERKAESHKKALEEGIARERRQYQRRMEIRHLLYKVIMKQLRRKRNFTINGQIVTVEDDPSINTILNAITLDQRLEAGYDNWPAIEARFSRIMSTLLPREKRVHSAMNSRPNTMQAMLPSGISQKTLLQNTKQLPSLNKEGMLTTELAHLSAGVVEKPGISTKAEHRNVVVLKRVQPGVSELVNSNEKILFHEQSVTISEQPPIPLKGERTIPYSPFRPADEIIETVGGIGGKQTNMSAVQKRQLSVTTERSAFMSTNKEDMQKRTISPTNPAQTHIVRHLKKARITKAVTKTIWPKLKETG